MKAKLFAISAAAAALLISGQASADLELAKKSGCLACHSVEKKVVGPAWKDVAAKYKGDAGAKDLVNHAPDGRGIIAHDGGLQFAQPQHSPACRLSSVGTGRRTAS